MALVTTQINLKTTKMVSSLIGVVSEMKKMKILKMEKKSKMTKLLLIILVIKTILQTQKIVEKKLILFLPMAQTMRKLLMMEMTFSQLNDLY